MLGFRGRGGALTVRVPSGHAERWTGLRRVLIAVDPARPEEVQLKQVVSSHAYGDRLVLELDGVNDAGAADELRGHWVLAPREELPALPDGIHYQARLVGLEARDESGHALGIVEDVFGAGGNDLLVIRQPDGHELLVPMARPIVREVSEDEGWIVLELPEGLRELNR